MMPTTPAGSSKPRATMLESEYLQAAAEAEIPGLTAFSLGWTTARSTEATRTARSYYPIRELTLWMETPDEAPSPSNTFGYGHCPETHDPRTG
jgi:hypothetical protein